MADMKTAQLIIYMTTIFLLGACANKRTSMLEVDRISLLRSMTYTHRNLVELQLEPESLHNTERKSQLLKVHCDLLQRGLVLATKVPEICRIPQYKKGQGCIAKFHRCIGECATFKKSCPRCEKTLQRCSGNIDR